MDINSFNTKISKKNNMPPWFVDLTKTINSRGVPLQTWNELVQMLSNAVSDLNTSVEFLKTLWDRTNEVTSEHISDGSINDSKLATGSVTTSKIADKAITFEKLSDVWTTEQQSAIIETLGIDTYVHQFLNMPEAEESEF